MHVQALKLESTSSCVHRAGGLRRHQRPLSSSREERKRKGYFATVIRLNLPFGSHGSLPPRRALQATYTRSMCHFVYTFKSAMMTLIPCSLAGAETLQNGPQAAARPQAQVWDGQQQGGARVAYYLEDKGARGVFTFGSVAGTQVRRFLLPSDACACESLHTCMARLCTLVVGCRRVAPTQPLRRGAATLHARSRLRFKRGGPKPTRSPRIPCQRSGQRRFTEDHGAHQLMRARDKSADNGL